MTTGFDGGREAAQAELSVSEAMRRRTSIRAFSGRPVSLDLVRTILDLARLAPSGGNVQPWLVHVVSGESLASLKTQAVDALRTEPERSTASPFYPPDLWEPHREWRREASRARAEVLSPGVSRDLTEEIFTRNFSFFGAPVGVFFCIDRRMRRAQWTDVGIFIQSVMLLAVNYGLDTCPQAIWINQDELVRRHLSLEPGVEIVSGMAMGYRQPDDRFCDVETERADLDAFVQFHGGSPGNADDAGLE